MSTVVAGDGDQVMSSTVKSLCKPNLIMSPVEVTKPANNSTNLKTSQQLEFGSATSFVNTVLSVTLPASNTSASVDISPKVAKDLPVEAVSLFCPANFYSPIGTCTSTVSSASASMSSTLSPLAEPFEVTGTATPHLYPAGKDKFGRNIITNENSAMHLDYFDVEPDSADVVPPATPDVKDVRGLRTWLVKLPDGQDFADRVLPPVTSDVSHNKQFPPTYFLDLHKKVLTSSDHS